MTAKVLTILAAVALAMAGATAASAAHKGASSSCKGEFMYMKDGKCMDARDKVDKKD